MAGTKKKKAAPASRIDEAARAHVETELRNALAGRDPDFASAVLARVVGTHATSERRSVDAWFVAAAEALADESILRDRVEREGDLARVALSLLAVHPWWTRPALVQAVSMVRGNDDEGVGKALADVLLRWPVLVRSNAFSRSEELSLFPPVSTRVRPLVEGTLSIGRARGAEPLPSVGLGRTLLALALFPGLVAQRRPRVTRTGDLHGADATKLERALGEARGLFATWERLGAFEEMEGALSPIVARVRPLLDDPGGIVRELLEQRLGEVGFALAQLASQSEAGDVLELGSALLAIGLRTGFAFGFDVPSLAARVERDDFRFAPLLHVDTRRDALAVPHDVRAAIRGEPLAMGPSASGFVQPNYEVVLPPGVPLGAAFVVSCAAELVHFEAVARLKLTRESVLAARSCGLDASDVVAALEAISAPRPLPPAIKHAVEEWASSVGEARVRTAVLFDVRAEGPLLDKVAEKLAPLVLDRPTRNLFVLSRTPNPRELAALRALGVVTRAVASSAPKRDVVHDDETVRASFTFRFGDRRRPFRDLSSDLDPQRVLEQVEASRPQRRTGAPTSTRGGAFDPDDGADRPLPSAIETALDERTDAWSSRSDWVAQLRQIVASSTFRRAAATNAGAVVLAVRRASDPQRLHVEIARIVAEASVRRAAD